MDILKSLDNLLVFLMRKLNRLHLFLIDKVGEYLIDNPNKYEALIPNENADEDGKYSETLTIALCTPKVNNIAITGAYGSGKSSFLRTFEKNNQGWEYLLISLAKFKDLHINQDLPKSPNEDESRQIIEKSILEQIFYKEKYETIPYSRFKRIKNVKNIDIFFQAIIIGFIGFYTFSIYFPEHLSKFFLMNGIDYTKWLDGFKNYFLLLIFSIGFYYFYQALKYVASLQISKFNFKKGELEVGTKDKASMLNEHLDEILYFFQVTSYNVVVIEDLDRFDNAEIFIKLRELNTLVNNSKDIGRRIVFIYAIKDDMFIDKDRTKFFDFILPIIPYINSTNSYLKIKEKFENEQINDDFLRDIALRIDEMRLLVNICNEYKLYKNKLTEELGKFNLSQEKLLAMIIYKNFYPTDFAELHMGKGELYTIFSSRLRYIKTMVDTVEKKKQQLKGDIVNRRKQIELEQQKTIEELRMIYLFRIYQKINSTQFNINNGVSRFNISDVSNQVKDEQFETIINSNTINHFSFTVIEKEVNATDSYSQRLKYISDINDEELEVLKKELEELSAQENEIKRYSIKDLAKSMVADEIFITVKDEYLLKYLVREGYINEDYHWYISHFFEGSLTQKDREFILSIQDGKSLPSDFELTNIKEIVLHLKERDFESKAILNYQLVEYFIQNKEDVQIKDKFDTLFQKLADGSNESKEFILAFIMITIESNTFVNKIVNLWKDLWLYIANESSLTKEKKEEYFKLFFDSLSVDIFLKLNVKNSLKKYIQNKEKLEQYVLLDNIKFQNLIEALNVKYNYIENPIDNLPLFNFIYEKNLYALNEKMINQIAYTRGASKQEIAVAHLTTIKTTYATKLIEYIEENINEYILNVFLKIETNTQESEDIIIELLNNKNIKDDDKVKIIQKEVNKIKDISKIINNHKIWISLFNANKVEAKWDNLLYYYQEIGELSETMVDFFNKEENYSELSKNKMNNEAVFSKEVLQQFSEAILLANEISDTAYDFLVKGILFAGWTNLKINNLSPKKVNALLENKKLKLTQDNINNLRESFIDKVIILIESFKSDLLEKIDEFELKFGDYLQILNSQKFTDTEKVFLIEKVDVSIFESKELVVSTNNLYIKNSKLIPMDLFEVLFEKSALQESLRILTLQIPNLDFEKISDCLNQFDSPYSDLSQKGAKTIEFEPSDINKELIKALEDKKYISSGYPKKNKIIVNRKRV